MCYEKLCDLVSRKHVGRGVSCTRHVFGYNLDVKNNSKKPEASEQMNYHGILGRAFADSIYYTMIVALENCSLFGDRGAQTATPLTGHAETNMYPGIHQNPKSLKYQSGCTCQLWHYEMSDGRN